MAVVSFDSLLPVSIDTRSMGTRWNPEPVENYFSTTEDIIAISCVAKRLGSLAGNIQHDTAKLAKSITAEDRFTAQNIRKFYNGKLIVAQLRNEQLTKFRQDLIKLLNTPLNENGEYVYSDKFAGMIYKLPYFYEYDRALIDEVFDGEYHEILRPIHMTKDNRATTKLTFIKKLDAFRKRAPLHEYWFEDHLDNRIQFSIDKSNPLGELLDHYLVDNELTINGYFTRSHKDTLEYYTVTYWNPVF